MIWGIEFSNGDLATKIARHLFNQGMIIETCGNEEQVIKLLPPLTISEENLVRGLNMISDTVLHFNTTKSHFYILNYISSLII